MYCIHRWHVLRSLCRWRNVQMVARSPRNGVNMTEEELKSLIMRIGNDIDLLVVALESNPSLLTKDQRWKRFYTKYLMRRMANLMDAVTGALIITSRK